MLFRSTHRSRICDLCVVMRLVVVVFEFALKVGRKDRVHGSGVDVTGFSMMGIRLGMDMEERQRQQPEDCPCAEQAVESEESAVNGTRGHRLLRRRYHRKRSTSRNEQRTRRMRSNIRTGNTVVCDREDISVRVSFFVW